MKKLQLMIMQVTMQLIGNKGAGSAYRQTDH